MTSNDLLKTFLDDFARFGVATIRAKITTAEFAMESLRMVDLIQHRHDITHYCPTRGWWQLKCKDATCKGKL